MLSDEKVGLIVDAFCSSPLTPRYCVSAEKKKKKGDA